MTCESAKFFSFVTVVMFLPWLAAVVGRRLDCVGGSRRYRLSTMTADDAGFGQCFGLTGSKELLVKGGQDWLSALLLSKQIKFIELNVSHLKLVLKTTQRCENGLND